jgi:hypothetical protein
MYCFSKTMASCSLRKSWTQMPLFYLYVKHLGAVVKGNLLTNLHCHLLIMYHIITLGKFDHSGQCDQHHTSKLK